MLWFKLLDCLFYLETLHAFRGLHFLDVLLACIQIFDYTEGSWKVFFFNWDSLHSRLNSHYEAWSFEKRSIKILNSCEGKEYVKEKVEIYTYFLRPEPFSRFSMRVVLNFLNPYDFWPRLLELPFPSILEVLQKASIHTPHLYLN